MAWEEMGKTQDTEMREGEMVRASITGKITCVFQGGIRIDTETPRGQYYPVWFYLGTPGVSVERVEDIRPGDVYVDQLGQVGRRGDGYTWWLIGEQYSYDDSQLKRPLTLIYRPEADS